jgi:prepilin-type N-terminal cleavage/methylation domain-containing protein/prepilin-type processing-associated H-X9-DG protein
MNRSSNPGFTLIELLVVVAIIAVLAALLSTAAHQSLAEGKRVHCLSNLRQFAIAAQVFQKDHEGVYPAAERTVRRNGDLVLEAWDFTQVRRGGRVDVEPGILWGGDRDARVQQCPSFSGESNWAADPYTGYNYNTSYIGRSQRPAHSGDIGRPAATALFGDGEWAGGANKFMRSPFGSPFDNGFSGRYAGTQGFRHSRRTNVAFCDGHAVSLEDRYQTYAGDPLYLADGTGFLSPDNGLYDLE